MTDSISTKPHTFVLLSGEIVLIDAVDRDLVESNGPWYAWCSPNTTYVQAPRRRTDGTRTSVYLHRLLLDPPEGMQIDHINRDGLDNRRTNLRVCTGSQNNANSPPKPGCSSEFKGVSWHKQNAKWQAHGRDATGKKLYLGLFTAEHAAARAYDAHAESVWGEFAWLNVDHFDVASR